MHALQYNTNLMVHIFNKFISLDAYVENCLFEQYCESYKLTFSLYALLECFSKSQYSLTFIIQVTKFYYQLSLPSYL